MDRNKANVGLCAILTTVAETGTAPEGVLYAGMMSKGYTLDDFGILMSVLRDGAFVSVSFNEVRLTDAGWDMAGRINAAVGGAPCQP